MATTYKTPGVYVEEISKFPPSVAAVETAIPAFIGYTQKAEKLNGDSLNLIPTRITSLLEYETYFGGPMPETGFVISITDTEVNGILNRVLKVKEPAAADRMPFLMYYSLQLYFANGGGPCYITSVGDYDLATKVERTKLKDGLDIIRKVDEPTLLVFPDATFLPNEDDFYGLYNDALDQCKDLQDRFTIIDTFKDDGTAIGVLRDKISSEIEFTKYGAAYYPYLETILDYAYDEKQTLIEHFSFEANAIPNIKAAIAGIMDVAIANALPAKVTNLVNITDADPVGAPDGAIDTISGKVMDLISYMNTAAEMNLKNADANQWDITPAKMAVFGTRLKALQDELDGLVNLKKSLKNEVNAAIASLEESAAGVVKGNIENARNTFIADFEDPGKIDAIQAKLADLKSKLDKAKTDAAKKGLLKGGPENFTATLDQILTANYKELGDFPKNDLAVTVNIFANVLAKATALKATVDAVGVGLDVNNGELNGRYLGDITTLDNATFNKIKLDIAALPLVLPPSSAIAGIYARIDNDRGVWKAPANANLNYVIKPTVIVSHEDQEDMNVHPTGKSVNAIRAFTGKGILVWGARTLAGNDNEWRYINVRRFFIFAEESIKKATERFVFESNDANTWVKVRAMIENFLTLQWRAGALAGATTQQAYYVSVGLNQTMTALDILEGRMIVEIGMAVVRPAEFIILRFSHKMQES